MAPDDYDPRHGDNSQADTKPAGDDYDPKHAK